MPAWRSGPGSMPGRKCLLEPRTAPAGGAAAGTTPAEELTRANRYFGYPPKSSSLPSPDSTTFTCSRAASASVNTAMSDGSLMGASRCQLSRGHRSKKRGGLHRDLDGDVSRTVRATDSACLLSSRRGSSKLAQNVCIGWVT